MEYLDRQIYRIPVESGIATGSPERLTQDADQNFIPSISPDGKRIAYYYANAVKRGIAVMDSTGANERPLVGQAGNANLYWRSPVEILFYNLAPQQTESTAIFSVNIETGTRQRVAQVSGLYWHYVPARQEILHHSPGGGGPRAGTILKALSLTDGTEREVAAIDYVLFVSPSPDGRRIAYVTVRPVEGSNQRRYELRLMSILGEFENVLIPGQTNGIRPGAWSPDGRFLLYSEEKNGLRVVNVETREIRPLHAETSDDNWRDGSWSPDGKSITVTKASSRSERLAWEGVTADAVAKLIETRR
jgi:Tol biopolymer transport system component